MLKQQVYFLNNLLMLIDAFCIIFAGYAAIMVKYYESMGQWEIDDNIFFASIFVVMITNNYMMGKFHLYGERRFNSYITMLWSIFKALLLSFGALFIGFFLYRFQAYSRSFYFLFAMFSFAIIAAYRLLFLFYLDRIACKNPYSSKIIIVGSNERCRYIKDLLESQLSWGHEVIGYFQIGTLCDPEFFTISCCTELEEFMRKNTVDDVIFALDTKQLDVPLCDYISVCRKFGLPCRILPAMWNPMDRNFFIENWQGVPFITLRTTRFNATGLFYKRTLDVAIGFLGTIVFMILYPVIGLAIKLDSPGPVIFEQKRIGKNGRLFYLLKFRTMQQDAEKRLKELMAANEMNGQIFKICSDPRITRVGKWLRKTSLDEIPQFLNVLMGEMSLVGTRPPLPEEVKNYTTDQLKRIAGKPGITGMWQVSGRNDIKDFDTITKLDWEYMENWCFSMDLKILLKTIWVVLLRKGAF